MRIPTDCCMELLPLWYDVDTAQDLEMMAGHLMALQGGRGSRFEEHNRLAGSISDRLDRINLPLFQRLDCTTRLVEIVRVMDQPHPPPQLFRQCGQLLYGVCQTEWLVSWTITSAADSHSISPGIKSGVGTAPQATAAGGSLNANVGMLCGVGWHSTMNGPT